MCLFIGIVIGIVVVIVFFVSIWIGCSFIGWNVGVWFYLFSLWVMMLWVDVKVVKCLVEIEDESVYVVLVMVCVVVIVSLFVILLELGGSSYYDECGRLLCYVFIVFIVFGFWVLIGIIFMLYYVCFFYVDDDDLEVLLLCFLDGICNFGYWDFLYFVFIISVVV